MIINSKLAISHTTSKGDLRPDNMAFSIEQISSGDTFPLYGRNLVSQSDIPLGYNFSVCNIAEGEEIIACGIAIGVATKPIRPFDLIIEADSGNIQSTSHLEQNDFKVSAQLEKPPEKLAVRTFKGFYSFNENKNEVVGIENNVVILTTVECVRGLADNVVAIARRKLLKDYPNVTNIFSISCGSGCGMPDGAPREELKRILIQIMNNPNIGKILLLGLGCEQISINPKYSQNSINFFSETVHNFKDRVLVENLQNYSDEIIAIEKLLDGKVMQLFEEANKRERREFPLSALTLGVKCGGSDRFSAFAANPVLGYVADKLVSHGGNVLITEVPEFEGVMHLMANRAVNTSVAKWTMNLISRFDDLSKNYPISAGGKQVVAPGNTAGGLVNAKLKSAGAMLKCGSSPLVGGLEYGESVYGKDEKGLFLVNGPSFDPIATTALGLAGAQIVVFTTGLGTPIGSALSKVLKLANRKTVGLVEQMDFFAEDVLNGRAVKEVGDELFDEIIKLCSGEQKSVSELMDDKLIEYGAQTIHKEFTVWKRWGDN